MSPWPTVTVTGGNQKTELIRLLKSITVGTQWKGSVWDDKEQKQEVPSPLRQGHHLDSICTCKTEPCGKI